MVTVDPREAEFQEAGVEGDERERWRSASATTPDRGTRDSGSSFVEVAPGHVPARHFVVLHAATGVVTRYERDVMPGGSPERFPLGDRA